MRNVQLQNGASIYWLFPLLSLWCFVSTLPALAASPAISVTAPVAGATWPAGSSQKITWSVSGDASVISYFKVAFSRDGGATYSNIVESALYGGSYTWTLPTASCSYARVRVRGMDRNGYIKATGESGVFIIKTAAAPIITRVSPSPVPGLDGKQTITVYGQNFVTGCSVILYDKTHADGPWTIAASLSNSGQISVQANFTNTTAVWTAKVVNSNGGGTSAVFEFNVAARLTPTPVPTARPTLTPTPRPTATPTPTPTPVRPDVMVGRTGGGYGPTNLSSNSDSWTDDPIRADLPIWLGIFMANFSSVPLTAGYDAKVMIDGQFVITLKASAQAAFWGNLWKIQLPKLTAGRHLLTILVDSGNAIDEGPAGEANNTYPRYFDVSPAPTPTATPGTNLPNITPYAAEKFGWRRALFISPKTWATDMTPSRLDTGMILYYNGGVLSNGTADVPVGSVMRILLDGRTFFIG